MYQTKIKAMKRTMPSKAESARNSLRNDTLQLEQSNLQQAADGFNLQLYCLDEKDARKRNNFKVIALTCRQNLQRKR